MSAGQFVTANYESTTLPFVMPIRVQPETEALVLGGATNANAGATITLPLRVNVSGNRNSLGVKPRTVTLAWTGTPPEGYQASGRLIVPILTETLWDAVDENVTTGTYLGAGVTVVGKTPEFKR